MAEIVIRAEKLGKRYLIGEHRAGYKTLRETLTAVARAPLTMLKARAGRGLQQPERETFWALDGIDLQVRRGEVLGIIGRNGAGKTTLLKVLSRITEPTTGRVELRGRVGSLLEVGTGFHPELTGRENIFLNGAILGMKRAEIEERFDDIVAFAEVDRFLDTPVKRYSSGMFVRLAFAVASHLEPEILIVDEVLAVGDAAFRKRCLGKMEDVSSGGRTVIFVSHNLAAIHNLCTRVLWLENGAIESQGEPGRVIEQYREAVTTAAASEFLKHRRDRRGDGKIRFTSFRYEDREGNSINSLRCGETCRLILEFENRTGGPLENLHVAVGIDSPSGERVTQLSSSVVGEDVQLVASGETRAVFEIARTPLMPGRYPISLYSTVNGYVADWIQNAGIIEISEGDFFGSGNLLPAGQGVLLVDHSFFTE